MAESVSNAAPGWDRFAAALIQARTHAGYPKRARFNAVVGVNDSTMQIIEGRRAGRVSTEVLGAVCAAVGWPLDAWRDYIEVDTAAATEVTGAAIKAARLARGWKLSDLAKALEAGPQAVEQWEAGVTPPPRKVQRIREVLFSDKGPLPESARPLAAVSELDLLAELTRRALERSAVERDHGAAHA